MSTIPQSEFSTRPLTPPQPGNSAPVLPPPPRSSARDLRLEEHELTPAAHFAPRPLRPLFKLLLPPSHRPAWFRCLVVLACVATAVAVRTRLDPMLGNRSPFALMLPAILVSAWLAGFRAGLVATAGCALIGAQLFLFRTVPFWRGNPADLLSMSLFTVQGLGLSLLCGVLHSVLEQWRRARQRAALDFENLANQAPGFIWWAHADGSPRFVNRNWLRFTGLEGWGSTADRLAPVHPADLNRVQAAFAEARINRTSYSIEYRLRRHDGQYRWILEQGLPQLDGDGALEGLVGSCSDVTTVHQEREELLFMAELQRALSSTLDIDKTAAGLARAIVPALADWCAIHLEDDEESGTAVLHSTRGEGGVATAGLDTNPAAAVIAAGARRVLATGTPLFTPGVDEAFLERLDPELATPETLRALQLNSYLAVPLRVHRRTIGVLSLATCASYRPLGDDTVQLAQRIAGIAAFALENARLFRRAHDALAAGEEARRAREKSEGQFRAAWEASVFGICVINRRGTVLNANDAFLTLSGYSAEDLANGRIDLHSHLGGREAAFGTFTWEHLPSSGPCEPFEKVCLRSDGRRVPVLVGGSIQPDGESCIMFLVDLTARRAAEAALERHRTLLRTIIDTAPALIAYLDPQERILHCNDAFSHWLDHRGPPPEGATLGALLGPDAYAEFRPHLQSALTGLPGRFETTLGPAGLRRDTVVSFRPDIDAAGAVAGVVIHAYDITELRQLGAAVAHSEKRYRTLISASATIVWTADATGAIVAAEGWEKFTGESIRPGSLATWWERIHAADRKRVETSWRTACQTTSTWECVYRLLARGGRYHHVHARAAAILAPTGGTVEWVGTITDIHGQAEAEQSLRRKEAELELVVDTVPALVAYVDKDLRFGLVNRAYEQWFGLEPAAIRGLPVRELLGETAFAEMYDKISRVLTGETVRYEANVQFKAGPKRWITARFTPHLGEDSRVLGYFSLILDISEWKATEAKLAESLERYRFLADAMPQNVWTTDASGRQDYANQRWNDYTGLSVEQRRSRTMAELVHPDDLQKTRAQWETALAEGSRFEIEHRLRDASGRYHWFLSRALARRDAEGQIVQWVGTATNIDAQRRAYAELATARSELKHHAENLEQEIRLRTARLEEVNAELEAFTYSASHDLRVPLHHVHEFAQAIANDNASKLAPRSLADLRLIINATERMDTLIVDLLAYSRLSRTELSLQPTNLDTVVDAAVAGHRATIERLGAKVTIRRPLPTVLADRVGLLQALSNLVGNALKFSAPERPVEIVVRGSDGDTPPRLWVEDNGIGIPPHQHQAIFNLFHRLNGGHRYPGTGIGLSLVAKAMARMGGSCGVESEPGAGSRFWIQFQDTAATPGSGILPQSSAGDGAAQAAR